MAEDGTDQRLVRLGPDDNVLVLATTIPAGTQLSVDGTVVRLTAGLTLGHKIAARPIAAGETVIKYGAPIGVATELIPAGAHVHIHNVRSAYTPSYVLPDAG
jgi:altronate dehydratase small subunit